MRKNSHIDVANNVTENEEKHRLHGRLMACRQRRQSGRWAQLVSVTSWSGPAAGGPRHQPPTRPSRLDAVGLGLWVGPQVGLTCVPLGVAPSSVGLWVGHGVVSSLQYSSVSAGGVFSSICLELEIFNGLTFS